MTDGLLERDIRARGQLDSLLPLAAIIVRRVSPHTGPQTESAEILAFVALVHQVHFLKFVLSNLENPLKSCIGYVALSMSINPEQDIQKCFADLRASVMS